MSLMQSLVQFYAPSTVPVALLMSAPPIIAAFATRCLFGNSAECMTVEEFPVKTGPFLGNVQQAQIQCKDCSQGLFITDIGL